uniref:Uncharacterized protein n=1 Tax=Triticum urartu TaxID=4572 RepID=A0A8R7UFS6_TRIUA
MDILLNLHLISITATHCALDYPYLKSLSRDHFIGEGFSLIVFFIGRF